MTIETDTTREAIEAALDSNRLLVRVGPAKYWAARRNGRTQTWKRDAKRFRIPIKAGLRSCGEITNANYNDWGMFQIKA